MTEARQLSPRRDLRELGTTDTTQNVHARMQV